MGKLFTLTQSVKTIIATALDDLITELGKDCRLVYPPRWEPCANCVADTTARKSSNRWRNGGPMPFAAGTTCPLCDGQGKLAQENFEVIKFLCAWEPKQFFYPIPNLDIRVPFSVIQVKGYLKDLPKVMRADHLVFQQGIEGLLRKRYKLSGEAGDRSNIIQGRYFVATMERFNG